MVAASIALILGGAGLIAVNSYAAAGEGQGPWPGGVDRQEQNGTRVAGPSPATVKCPEVANGLPQVPEAARPEVDRELATLDGQITEAYQRFADEKEQVARDPQFARNAILGPLESKRTAGIDRIAEAIGRVSGQRPEGLRTLAPCTLQTDDADQADPGSQGGGEGDHDGGGNGGQAGNGPEASDFADIRTVQPNVQDPPRLPGASRGTFTTDCGVNANGKFNPDNVIAAPGVSNGAHHMHDYVGNQANDAFASDDDLASGETTCRDQGDRSTYYWPVLRLQNGQDEDDARADGGGKDRNVGEILTPSQVTLDFVGNPQGKVTAMPRFLRIITGDAKAFVNGDANANASWSCTGFEDRQLRDKYPICPGGSKVVRSFRFQSCWDGRNTDSANHRTHVAFTDASGRCPGGFLAVPQLVQRIVYDVPPPVFDGPDAAVFALDSFPEQLHKPVTDHGDFINVFDERLMRELVSCLNEGRRCGPGDPVRTPAGDGQEPKDAPATATGAPAGPAPSTPAEQETGAPTRPAAPAPGPEPVTAAPHQPAAPAPGPEPVTAGPHEPAAPDTGPEPVTAATRQPAAPDAGEPGTEGAATEAERAPGPLDAAAAEPEASQAPAQPSGRGSRSGTGVPADPGAGPSSARSEPAPAVAAARSPETTAGTDTTAPASPTATNSEPTPSVPNGGVGAPQAAEGALARTGAQLWPSAAGAALLITGVALLRVRTRPVVPRHR
ncbi:DUF1996 domain-containing protein [Streptomyces xantholiticus]|uniref:DUF1996 domain-containing protein n=1 Tax=Streptomyces xantholiticus TaxID=68285 RepID=A0ABV1UTM7_9ACTN